MKRLNLILSCVLFFVTFLVSAQSINYQVRIVELRARADNNDGGGLAGAQDPTWFVWVNDNGTTGTSYGSTWQATGCIHTTNQFNAWWFGGVIPYNFNNVTNSDATTLNAEIEGWEEDCSNSCQYDPSPSFFSSCVGNGDDNRDARAAAGSINFRNDPPCQWNSYIYTNNRYDAKIEINWQYVDPITPGIIAGDQVLCGGGDPTLLTSVSTPIPTHSSFTYQWQVDAGCTGNFVNINGATNSTYDPLLGIAQTSCFRRVLKTLSCGDFNSNTVTVTIENPSVDPTGASASLTSLCVGESTNLSISGGSLGAGAQYVWYEGGCGSGASIGTGATLNVSPSTSTQYFARIESGCYQGSCVSVSVTVNQSSTEPTAIIPSATQICPGENLTLSVQGGNLAAGNSWVWYSGSCGGQNVGTGSIVSINPTASGTYFVRAEGACGNTNCQSINVVVSSTSTIPTSVTASQNNICPGISTILTLNGGSLQNNDVWVWYTGACGAVPVGVGTTLTVTPIATTTYYVRAVGDCGASPCQTVTVDVQNGSLAPTSVASSNNNFCKGENATLTVEGGSLVSGANWTWYESTCGGQILGTGPTLTVAPTSSNSYFVRAEGGACGNTECASIFLNVQNTYAYLVPFDTICGLQAPFLLTGGLPTGGVYSGNGVINNLFYSTQAGVGTSKIYYTYTGDNGCVITDSTDLTIVASQLSGTAQVSVNECSDGGVQILVSPSGSLSGDYTFTWNTNQIANPLRNVPEGSYSVTIGDGSGCTFFIDSLIVDETLLCFDIPNTFSPNADGTNDTWNVNSTNIGIMKTVSIFSKWGQVVYEASEVSQFQWDGTYKSEALPPGTYYYIMEIDNPDYGKQSGPITIVR
jgi:gliding motility-associated-like protein